MPKLEILRVYCNNALVCTAGLSNPGHFTARVVLFRRDLGEPIFEIHGFDFTKDTIIKWPSKTLKRRDEIIMVIEEADFFDNPISGNLIKNKNAEFESHTDENYSAQLKSPWE